MCVEWHGGWRECPDDMIALKVVRVKRDGRYISANATYLRFAQNDIMEDGHSSDNSSVGTEVEYTIGEEIHDNGEWGFYCFESTSSNRFHFTDYHKDYVHDGKEVLAVRIPKGTMIRHSTHWDRLTINAKTIVPVGIMEDEWEV